MRRAIRFATIGLLGVALVAAMALTGCGQQSSGQGEGSAATTYKVGFAAPLTGDNAVYGQGMQRAVQLAIDEANASQEAKDAKVQFEIVAQDDASDPKQAVNVANSIVGDRAIMGVAGHFNSGCSIPAAPVYDKANLAMVSVSSNPALTANGLQNVNRIVARDDTQGSKAGELVADQLKLTKVAVIDDSTPYGQGLAAEFVKTFTGKGGTVVIKESVGSKDQDFTALVTRIKPLDAQAIYFAGSFTQGALLTKQAKEDGLKVPVIGGDMLYSPEYVKVAGAANAEGDIATSLGLPLDKQPKGSEFKAAYAAAYDGAAPEAYDSYAYDSANIIIQAVLDSAKNGTVDRATVEKAIRGITWEGVTGTTSFDSNGDTTNQAISVYVVKNGEWVPFE